MIQRVLPSLWLLVLLIGCSSSSEIVQEGRPAPERAQRNSFQMVTSDGDTLTGIFLKRIRSDSLVYFHSGRQAGIYIDDIVEIRLIKKKSEFWGGAGRGAVIGGFVGSLVGSSLSDRSFIGLYGSFYGALHGGLYGALIGSAVELFSSSDVSCRMQKMTRSDRIEALNSLLTHDK